MRHENHVVIDVEATVKHNALRGRPNKTLLSAGNDAAYVVEVAMLIKQGRKAALKAAGFTEATALRYVQKRRRGLMGGFVGKSVQELLFAEENRTKRGLQLVIEHGFKVSIVAKKLEIDLRNLRKALPLARIQERKEAERRKLFALGTTVTDSCVRTIYLPRNTTAQIVD
jgi:hypothetical protein